MQTDSNFNKGIDSTPTEWSESLFSQLLKAKVLLKQFGWIFIITILGCVAFQGYCLVTKPILYISNAQMIVSGRITIPEGSMYREEVSNFFGTQIKLMESNIVRTRAQDRALSLNPGLKPMPVNINAAQSPQASIFLLTAQGENAEYTTAYLNAIMQEYLNFKSSMRTNSAQNTFLSITEKIMEIKEEIEEIEDKKLKFQQENNIVFIKEQGNTVGKQLATLQDKLDNLKLKERWLKSANIESFFDKPFTPELEQIITNPDFQLDFDTYVKTDDLLEKLRAQKVEMLGHMREIHPYIIDISNQINKQENILKILKRQHLEQLIDKRNAISYEIKNLEPVVAEWSIKALDYSKRLAEFEQIESKLERLKKSQEQLMSSTQSIEINKNLDQESVSILEVASPAAALAKNYVREGLLGFSFGIFLGAFIIFIIGVIDTRIYSAEDIQDRYSEPVLGNIPKLKTEQASVLMEKNDKRSMFAEANRSIRSAVIYQDPDRINPKVFLVTSSIPAEGKSTIAANLAISTAFSCNKVLLIDADLRCGHLNENLKLNKQPGLAEAIQERLAPEQFIQKTSIENLDFISTGKYPAQPDELFLNPYLEDLFLKFRKTYDYIILDSAPVLATNDSINLASKSDTTLFVCRSTVTRTRQFKTAIHSLKMHNAHIFGFIINGIEAKNSNYYYYKYNKYY